MRHRPILALLPLLAVMVLLLGCATPDSAPSGSATPDSATPDSATPDSATPDSATPDSAASNREPPGTVPGSATVVPAAPPGASGRLSDVPADLDTRTTRPSANGAFTGTLRRSVETLPLNALHGWVLTLTDADGQPVTDATIRVDGGMPQHAHGLPTQPRVDPSPEPGTYPVAGVKFHMHGWWRLTFDIQAAGTRDVLEFDFVVD